MLGIREITVPIGDSLKLSFYHLHKHKFAREAYLNDTKGFSRRYNTTQLRISAHDLEIERGRYANVPRDERICTWCNTSMGAKIVEDESLLLDGGWTTKSPADGNKSLSLPKTICSQEVVSSCLGKDLSAWRRSTNSGTDYSGRDHITVKYCFWITRLVKKHSYSVLELPDGLFCSRSQRTTTR